MRYAVITRHRREFPLRLMCRVLEVAPSGYYAWRNRAPSLHALADELLMARVRCIFADSGETYGAVRTLYELQDQGVRTSKKRVARLQREAGLLARPVKRRWVTTTDSRHGDPVAPNHLQQQFMVETPNTVWASDITYLPTRTGWAYLAVVLDLASRRCVGWSVQETLAAALPLAALRMALVSRRPTPGLLHHSDRGSQYAGAAYQALLARHGAVASMSSTGNCYDNAVVESFFSTLEFELIRKQDWDTPADARAAVGRYLEGWYNARRRHSTLGYRSPAGYEAQVFQAA
jgi:transposase InsO family protein